MSNGIDSTITDLEIKEMIRLCIDKHSKKFKHSIDRTKLLKILYKTNEELSENNPLKNVIPFYWYRHGPYSELAINKLDEMENDNMISKFNNFYSISKGRLVEHKDYLQEYRKTQQKLIDKIPAQTSIIVDEIYKDVAPCKFYKLFKIEFQSSLNNYFNIADTTQTPENLRFLLMTSIGGLPTHPLFSKFKDEYCDFMEIMSDLVKINLSNNDKIYIQDKVEQVLNTFAYGIRILYHDVDYDSQISKWEKIFDNSLKDMENSINELYRLYEKVTHKKSNLRELSEITDLVINLRSKNKLEMIYLYPSNDIPNTKNGNIDAEIFHNLNDKDFVLLLNKFDKSRKAILNYNDDNYKVKSINYRLITS